MYHLLPCCGHIHCLLSINIQASISECQWVPFFPRGGIQYHTFALYALPCWLHCCQTALLLPSVTQKQNVVEYCQEGSASTAIQPVSVSGIVGQHNKTGSITFRAALILCSCMWQNSKICYSSIFLQCVKMKPFF